MYGLFKNYYAFYEWHDLICVSESEGGLVEHYANLESSLPLLSGADQEEAKNKQSQHYVIEKIKVV